MFTPKSFVAGLALLLAAIDARAAERVTKGSLVLENIPEIPAVLAERMLQYQNTRGADLESWHPAGEGVLITTRFGNTGQVHYVERPGGYRRQLTFYNEPISRASFAPGGDGRGFLFSRDVGGGEFYQLYWFDLATGRAELLTDGKSRNGGVTWSNAGTSFAYTSTRRNGRDNDLYLASLSAPAEAKLIKEVKGLWSPVDWSPDDTRLLVVNFVSINESYLHVLDLASGQLTPVNAKPSGAEAIAYQSAAWSKDGKGLWLASDEGSEFSRLRYYDLATGEQAVITGDIPWDVETIELAKDGRTLAFVANEGGRSMLYLLDTRTRRYTPVRDLPIGGVASLHFSPDSARLGFRLTSAQTQGDVYVLRIADRSLERWTFSETGGLDAAQFVSPTIISYPTFDHVDGRPRQIPALYYRPAKALAGGRKHPVLINIHGGPESQATVGFAALTSFFVNELGLAVILPNVRGSSGYGKSYLKLDNGRLREDSVKDIGALLDWIAQQPELDANRVAVYGGSYGGYMVLACMTHYNDRIAAAIDVVGISNFVTFLTNTQDYRRDLRRVEYGDERDPEMRAFLEKISPLTNISKITKPMLIAQGYNDPRVPVGEAEQVVAALKKNGVTPWYFLAMDEGHGFAKKANSNYFQNAMVLFLEEHLLKK